MTSTTPATTPHPDEPTTDAHDWRRFDDRDAHQDRLAAELTAELTADLADNSAGRAVDGGLPW